MDIGMLVGGRYRVLEILVAEGPDVVARAWDEHLHRTVSIRAIRDPAPFIEGHSPVPAPPIFATVDHPRLLRPLDGGEDRGHRWVATEWRDAPTLTQRLTRGPLERDAVVRLIDAVAGALASLHAEGIGHGRLCADHVQSEADGSALLVEVGYQAVANGPPPGGTAATGTHPAADDRAATAEADVRALCALTVRVTRDIDAAEAGITELVRRALDPAEARPSAIAFADAVAAALTPARPADVPEVVEETGHTGLGTARAARRRSVRAWRGAEAHVDPLAATVLLAGAAQPPDGAGPRRGRLAILAGLLVAGGLLGAWAGAALTSMPVSPLAGPDPTPTPAAIARDDRGDRPPVASSDTPRSPKPASRPVVEDPPTTRTRPAPPRWLVAGDAVKQRQRQASEAAKRRAAVIREVEKQRAKAVREAEKQRKKAAHAAEKQGKGHKHGRGGP